MFFILLISPISKFPIKKRTLASRTSNILIKIGSANRVRTYDLELRSLLLYPAELWRQVIFILSLSREKAKYSILRLKKEKKERILNVVNKTIV